MQIVAHASTHPGTSRPLNEDAWLIDPDLSLYIVSDGITHPAGAECSQRICKSIQAYLRENRSVLTANEKAPTSASRQAVLQLLREAIEKASFSIYSESRSNPKLQGVFGTVCAVLISRGFAFIAHLGDSRVYSVRDGKFSLLTRDHTYLAAMLAEGTSLEQAKKVMYSGNLSGAVGYEPVAKPSLQIRELARNERLLICTDGLSDHFSPESSGDSFGAPEWTKAATATLPSMLQEFALKKGARDNLTSIAVEWNPPPPREDARSITPPDVLAKIGTIRGIRLFQHFGERSLMKILGLSDSREIPAGEVLIQRGGILDEMFIVLRGELSIDLGQGPLAARVKKGEVVGEMSLFDGSLPSATLVALEPTLVLSLHRDRLFRAMREDAEFAARFELGVLQAVIQRLRERTEPGESLKAFKNQAFISILPPE